MSRTTSAFVVAGCLALSIAGCAAVRPSALPPVGAGATPARSSPAVVVPADSITIKGFEFEPARLSVQAGATVTWTNEEDSFHTVTAGTPDDRSGLFDSGEFDTGGTFEFTFPDVGAYPFFCDRHEFMRGEVIVGG